MDESVLDALGRCPPDAPVYDPPAAAAYLGIADATLRTYRSSSRPSIDFPTPAVGGGVTPRWTRSQLDTFNSTRRSAGRPRKDTPAP